MDDASQKLVRHLGECFGLKMRAMPLAELESALAVQETPVAVA
jgi:hypothetical protein